MKIIFLLLGCSQVCFGAVVFGKSCNFQACADILDPVCGTNGKTYGERIVRFIKHKKRAYQDIRRYFCVNKQRNKMTVYYHSKVKGNTCYLNLEKCHGVNVALKHNGVCTGYVGPYNPGKRLVSQCPPKMCTMIYRPVCGSDGLTYGDDNRLGILDLRRREIYNRCRENKGADRGNREADLCRCFRIISDEPCHEDHNKGNACELSANNCTGHVVFQTRTGRC